MRWTLFLLGCAVNAYSADEPYAVFQKVVQGYAAFCRPSVVDELQLIGDPRRLSVEEAQQIAAIFSAESTWYERQADGSRRGMINFAIPHYDFKFLLSGRKDTSISIRLDSFSRRVIVTVDGVYLKLPNITKAGLETLGKMFESWYPGWRTTTYRNLVAWETRQRPNKAPEPTPTAVMPAAEQPSRRP